VQATTTRPKIAATADGEGVVSDAGSRLVADVAGQTTLTGRLSEVLGGLCRPRTRHDPGRVLVDMAVAVADGATTICDVAVLAWARDKAISPCTPAGQPPDEDHPAIFKISRLLQESPGPRGGGTRVPTV
jgi:hypothetical protein